MNAFIQDLRFGLRTLFKRPVQVNSKHTTRKSPLAFEWRLLAMAQQYLQSVTAHRKHDQLKANKRHRVLRVGWGRCVGFHTQFQ